MGRWVILFALLLCFQSVLGDTINVPGDLPTIQAAVAAAVDGDIIAVAAGTYTEQIRIDDKDITLQGAGIGQSTIEAVPLTSRTTYSVTTWAGDVRTIDACVGVTGSTVSITGFTIDGKALGPDNFYGIHYFNSDGVVTNCRLVDITDAVGTGSSRVVSLAATHGVGGTCAVDFNNNEVPVFQKGGILLMGPSASGHVNNNTVIGGGTTVVAQNGIQISYGAQATLSDNQVSMVAYPGTDWAGTGITLFECGNVAVSGGTLTGCQIAIGHSQWNWIYTPPSTPTVVVDGVTLDQNEWAVTTHLAAPGAALNLEVRNCAITNTVNSGVDLYGSGVDPWGGSYYQGWTNGALTANIHDNEIANGGVGIAEVVDVATGNSVMCDIGSNDLGGNGSHGVYNNFSNLVDATANWWGDASGPGFATKAATYTPQPRTAASPYSPLAQEIPYGVLSPAGNAEKGNGSPVTVKVDYSPWWGGNYLDDPHTSAWDWHVDPSNNSTIQEGVNIAGVGDVVHVEAGTYEEQVVIGKELSLIGAGKEMVTLQAPTSVPQYFTTGGPNHPIIFVNGAEVTISDMSIDGLARGNANYRFVGIGFWNAGGAVTNIDITRVCDDPFSGSQHGVGVYAFNNTGGPYHLEVTDVKVTEIQKAGIVLGGGGLNASVTNCSVTGRGPTAVTAQNGIQVGFGANGTITNCTVADVAYTAGQWGASGILFYQAANGAVATGSVVSGSQAAIVFHETSGSVDGATVTASGTNNEEGVSVREYGEVKSGTPTAMTHMTSPLEDNWERPTNTKAAPSVVVLSNLHLTGAHTPGSYGVTVWVWAEFAAVTLINSDIQGWDLGVVAYDDGGAPGINASHNRIYNNNYGFWTNSGLGQLAERNYWGSDRGPTHPTNPNGDGDEVSDKVDYEPWCNFDFTICDIMVSCCRERVGNANGIGTYPNEVTISDIQLLVFAKFISSLPCDQNLPCLTEADVNQSGGVSPKCPDITISDIQTLVNHLFIAGPANAPLKICL